MADINKEGTLVFSKKGNRAYRTTGKKWRDDMDRRKFVYEVRSTVKKNMLNAFRRDELQVVKGVEQGEDGGMRYVMEDA